MRRRVCNRIAVLAAIVFGFFTTGSGVVRLHGQTVTAMVQHASKDAGATGSSSLAFAANNAAGNFIAVAIRAGVAGATFNVTDSRGNSYRQAVRLDVTVDAPAGDTLALFYAENVGGGANTVTVSQSTGTTLRFAILEYSGVATVNSFDVGTAAQGTSASPSSGTVSTTASGDLVVGAIVSADSEAYTAGSGYVLRDAVPSSPASKLATEDRVQSAAGAASATAALSGSNPWGAVVAAFRAGSAPTATPDLTISKTHTGNFTQGQTGATYTLTVRNGGSAATSGSVTVTDSVPAGLVPTAAAGTGWGTCAINSQTVTCTRTDALAAQATYPSLTLTVNVASTAPASVTNAATVSGGSETNTANDTATDVTSIAAVTPTRAITLVQHAGRDAGTTTSSSLAFPSANTAGNWIGVAVRAGGTGQTFAVSDSRGNSYRRAIQFTESIDGTTLGIFYAENIAAGSNTVTVTDTQSNTLRFAILEYAGVAASNSLENAAAAQATSATPSAGPVAATAGDLALGLVSTANPANVSAGSGFVLREFVPAEPNTKLAAEDRVVATSGPISATASLGGTDAWGAAIAAFRAAGGTSNDTQSPSAPSSLRATAASSTRIDLTWTASTDNVGVTGYQVERCPGSGCTNFAFVSSTAATTFSDTGLISGAAYTYRVLAQDAAGNRSAYSNTAGATTAAGTTMTVSPRTVVLTPILNQQFTAANANGTVTWAVDGVPGGTTATGRIGSTGLYVPPSSAGAHTVTATDQTQSVSATVYISTYAGTFTRDVDNIRTGLNPAETVLAPANVNSSQFGKLYSYSIDGVSDASPLYLANVSIPGKGLRNVVYVATEHDSVFAFDADGMQTSPLWQVSFINPGQGITTVPSADTGECCDISPEIGVTGTPVIDRSTNTLYVVAKTKEVSGGTTTYVHRLHALDVATGAEKLGGPVVIQATVPGTGDGAVGGRVPFNSLRENQRAALLLNNGVVYIAFASHGDNPPYHGWVLGYSASTLQQVMVFNSTPNGEGGGIWQSGDGLAADANGNLFFVTGDGTFDANGGGRDYGDSILKISPAGAVLDYFTPHDQATMNANDLDLGSGGTILLPDQPGTHPHLALSAGKNGTIYVVDRDNMGHYLSGNDGQIVQAIVNSFPGGTFITGNFKAPVYWNGYLYFSADADYIKAFRISNGLIGTTPASQSSFIVNYPGATLGMSSNGTTAAVLWVIERVDLDPVGGGGTRGPGILHAFDATNLAIELYSSDQAPNGRDGLDYAAKWAAPLVANGKVFVATNSRLTVFGLLR
jgi:hypothetical protein